MKAVLNFCFSNQGANLSELHPQVEKRKFILKIFLNFQQLGSIPLKHLEIYMSNEQKPGCSGYIGDDTTVPSYMGIIAIKPL